MQRAAQPALFGHLLAGVCKQLPQTATATLPLAAVGWEQLPSAFAGDQGRCGQPSEALEACTSYGSFQTWGSARSAPCFSLQRAYSVLAEQQSAAAPATRAGSKAHIQASDLLSRPGMEDLMQVLLQPMPLTPMRNKTLNDIVLKSSDGVHIDPAKALESTVRALHVIKQVLRQNGNVYVLNGNERIQPLLKEAARCCLNANVWFSSDQWTPGLLSGAESHWPLFSAHHQPNRRYLEQRCVPMQNVHCLVASPTSKPKPRLETLDKYRLLWRSRSKELYRDARRETKALLKEVVALETKTARLPLPNSSTGAARKVSLLVVLDLSHGIEAVQEAHAHNVPCVSLVNAHSDLSLVTYPVLVPETNLAFQHLFLDYLLKVVNNPDGSFQAPQPVN